LTSDLARLQTNCERTGDLFLGLTILFGAVGALVVVVGVLLHAPLFAFSAGFAFAAAVAFGACARRLGRTERTIVATAVTAAPRRASLPLILQKAA